MTLFILSSNNERIPFQQPKKTPLVLTSTKRLKEQERIPYNTAKRTKEDAMKQKQFGSLEIVITKRKLQVPTTPVKKRKECQSKCIDKISFPENLDDSFHHGLLGNTESSFANTILADKVHISQELPKPQAPVKENEQPRSPEFTVTAGRYYGAKETAITKTPPKKFPPKFKIPETPLLNKISETSQVGKSFIPETPQRQLLSAHQNSKRNWLLCSAIPETPLLDGIPVAADYYEKQPTHFYTPETPVAQMKNTEKENRERRAGNWGKTRVQVVPETPKLKLKSTDELSLYD
ncbi:uncharacterized protein LOC144642701 isoform X1 [Oculina patagonica]